MTARTIVITGATSGIGEVAACRLAAQGARIVLIARDRERAQATLDKLEASAPGRGHTVHYADLSRLVEMKRVAHEVLAREQQIDVLVNNAGALFNHRELTEDGLERTFATNRARLRWHARLRPLETHEHPVHARARATARGNGGDCQLPASGIRRHTFR
jgi:NAD(P)-dependent dehydrogenase (short-subunit alcohol dehydrogenase family)